MEMAEKSPILYDDSLLARATTQKYRKVGNPYAFLNSIGLDPILEHIYKGSNIVDVAKELNISITILLNWLENEGHMQRIEEATKFSAEGYISEAGNLLRTAQTDFQLKKAKEVANHGRFMASKLDKSKYGADNKQVGNTAGVTFIMHMGDKTITATATNPNENHYVNLPPPKELGFIDGTYNPTELTVLPVIDVPPLPGVREPDSLGPFEPVPFEPTIHLLPGYLFEGGGDE